MAGSWQLVDSDAGLVEAASVLAVGSGLIGVDVERAQGYRYSGRAYLVQLFREGAGAFLFDPLAVSSFLPLAGAVNGVPWIFHSAVNDLPGLYELGLVPESIFDTEVAARILGMSRTSLSHLLELYFGVPLDKSFQRCDWSRRPLPASWCDYAAGDVVLLPGLASLLAVELESAGRLEWARQEFAWQLRVPPAAPVVEPWRRLKGLGVLGDQERAVAKELWLARDRLAFQRDVGPGRLIPDSAILAVARAVPKSCKALLGVAGFSGRASRSELRLWWRAVQRGLARFEPAQGVVVPVFPHPRTWVRACPLAAVFLRGAREAVSGVASSLGVASEVVLSPVVLKELCWFAGGVRGCCVEDVSSAAGGVRADVRDVSVFTVAGLKRWLLDAGVREWQVRLVLPVLLPVFLEGAAAFSC